MPSAGIPLRPFGLSTLASRARIGMIREEDARRGRSANQAYFCSRTAREIDLRALVVFHPTRPRTEARPTDHDHGPTFSPIGWRVQSPRVEERIRDHFLHRTASCVHGQEGA